MNFQSSLQQRRSDRLYFAFGSNMHLGQMAKRCPESRYIGIAKLHDHRFQINQRGFANVLPSPGDCVEGLVYLLNLTDEQRLDKNEAVPTAYQKCNLAIEVFTAAIELVGRAVLELTQRLEGSESHTIPLEAWADKQINTPAGSDGSKRLQESSRKGQVTEALVYMSKDFVQDSEPRDEYIDRMNAGIIDARKLGMSDMYVGACLRHYIRDRELPDQEFISKSRSRQSDPKKQYRSPESKHRSRYETITTKTLDPAIDPKRGRNQKNLKRDDIWSTESGPHQREGHYDVSGRFHDFL